MLSSTDPFDPSTWETDRLCRIYDPDMERFAIVDEEFFSQLVTTRDTHKHRTKKLITRRWAVKPTHVARKGKKEYFVSNAGWRRRKGTFLHVLVMKLSGRRRPSKRHRYVNHKNIPLPPGLPIRFKSEWDCRLANLEWSTALHNRRTATGSMALNPNKKRKRSRTKDALRARRRRREARLHKS
jgi:hypothetical protein